MFESQFSESIRHQRINTITNKTISGEHFSIYLLVSFLNSNFSTLQLLHMHVRLQCC